MVRFLLDSLDSVLLVFITITSLVTAWQRKERKERTARQFITEAGSGSKSCLLSHLGTKPLGVNLLATYLLHDQIWKG